MATAMVALEMTREFWMLVVDGGWRVRRIGFKILKSFLLLLFFNFNCKMVFKGIFVQKIKSGYY